MRRLRVLVADDHEEMLAALVSVIEDDPRFVVVSTAKTGAEARRIAEDEALDLVLLDVNMPGGGPEVAEAIAALPGAPTVVAVSAESGARRVNDMLAAGAVGYLVKGRLGDGLPDLLIECLEGDAGAMAPGLDRAH